MKSLRLVTAIAVATIGIFCAASAPAHAMPLQASPVAAPVLHPARPHLPFRHYLRVWKNATLARIACDEHVSLGRLRSLNWWKVASLHRGEILRIPAIHVSRVQACYFLTRQATMTASVVPAPPAGPQAVPSGALSPSEVGSYWLQAGGPADAEAQAERVAMCESTDYPDAQNASGASGLWQILGQVVAGNIFDPLVNAKNAVAKYTASGWAPWAESQGCWG